MRSSFLDPAIRQEALADLLVDEPILTPPLLGRNLGEEIPLQGEGVGDSTDSPIRVGDHPPGDPDRTGVPLLTTHRERLFEGIQRPSVPVRVEMGHADVMEDGTAPAPCPLVHRTPGQLESPAIPLQLFGLRRDGDRDHVYGIDRQGVLAGALARLVRFLEAQQGVVGPAA